MNCTKCGKEIPERENKICEDCQKELVDEIKANNKAEEQKAKKTKVKKTKVKISSAPSEKIQKIKEVITKNVNRIVTIILAILLIVLVANIFNSNDVGNLIGNIRNYGYAAEDGNWVYFFSPGGEDNDQIGVFKMRQGDKDQKSKKELIMDSWELLSLNVSEKYVYFIGILPDAFSDTDEKDNKIYRMKKDGSDLQVINDNEFNNECYEIYVIDNKVYYMGEDYNIYKMNSDGSNRELVLDNKTGYLGITDKYIIYNVENPEQADYITYVADIDGKNARPIIENTRLYSVNVIDDYVYYTNDAKQICRVTVDGRKQEVLYEVTAYNMNVSGKYVYYLNYADEANSDYTVCIFRVKTNGSTKEPEKIKSLESYTSFIDIVGDWVVYIDRNSEEVFVNFAKTNGKEDIKVYTLNLNTYYQTGTEEEVVTDGESEDTTSEEVPENPDTETPPTENVDESTEEVDTNTQTDSDATNTTDSDENATTEENDNTTAENVVPEKNTTDEETTAETEDTSENTAENTVE